MGKDRDSVTRSGIILKALCGLGIAREVGRKSVGSGRPATLYEVPDPIVIPLGLATQVQETAPEEPKPVRAMSEPVSVAAAPSQGYIYDDDDDDD